MDRWRCLGAWPGRAAVAVLLVASAAWPSRGQTGSVSDPVTDLASLAARAGEGLSREIPIRIEGSVWWSSAAEGRMVLRDDTAALQLELDLPCVMPQQGDRLRLSGACSVTKARDAIRLSPVPVVENGGLHMLREQSETVHLPAGRLPVRLAWFNRTDRFGLQLEYEGPGIALQRIPDSMLWRTQVDPQAGTTNWVLGLSYRCCEGQWWRLLPNFDHLAAARTGTVRNFDLAVRSRDSHVGLLFSGYLDILKEGDYTFHLASDDGSRLFIGPSSLKVEPIGSGELPQPLPVPLRENPAGESALHWSAVEGDVVSVHRSPDALDVELMTDSGLVRLKVAEDSIPSYALHPQNRIRAVGVSRRIRNLDGRWMRGEFFVQGWTDIEQRYISPAIWTDYPVLTAAQLRLDVAGFSGNVVHLQGRVDSKDDGPRLTLSDRSGEIGMEGAGLDAHTGRFVDVLGYAELVGTNLVLKCILVRPIGQDSAETGRLPLLTTIEQIYQLSLEESAREYPVQVRGVITSPMESDGAVLQDSSRGIYVVLGGPINLQVGDYCEIEGVTGPYLFSQFIEASRVDVQGAGTLPEPVQPTWDQLINGSLHCNYVELEGVVTSIREHTVMLLTRGGRINVRLNPAGAELPQNALGATIRLRGCLLADWDGESHRVVVGSIYLDQHWVAVVHPAPVNPFAIPLKHVGDLLQFDPQAGALQRVKVAGQLVPGNNEVCCLVDEGGGLRFIPVNEVPAQVGDLVEVVGFLELGGSFPVLREAQVRKTGRAPLPLPRRLEPWNLMQDEYDSTRVQIEGVLLGLSRKPDKVELEMQSALRRFVAELSGDDGWIAELKPGSLLELSGTYLGEGGNRVLGRPIDSFRLLLHDRSDIRELSRPPWWTLRRMLGVVGILAMVLAVALVWIKLLRRKVEARTEELGSQIRERQRAERQREIEKERARLAHDLHDDLGAGLTEVNMLASLIKSPSLSAEEKKRYADELNAVALRMVTSLDEIVWAVNPRNDTVASLAGYFGAYAQRFLELASITCGLNVSENLPDCSLDPAFRQDLFLAFKEALSNVVQHAQAKKVWLRIFIQVNLLVVMVSDDGCGIPAGERGSGADGLANMKERMQALRGSCTIHSDSRTGTVVRLEAPIRGVHL